MRAKTLVLLIASAVAVSLATSSTAGAFWPATGTGVTAAMTATLAAPTEVIAPGQASTSVPVQWTASPGPVIPDGYFVTRTTGTTITAACGSSKSSLLSATGCSDSPTVPGSYVYTVTAVHRSWTAASVPSTPVRFVTATHLQFASPPATTAAGIVFSTPVRVAVRAADNSAVQSPGVAVTVALSANAAGGVLAGTLTRLTDALGVATFDDLSIDRAQSGSTLTASGTGLIGATSAVFTVTKPPLASLDLKSAQNFSAFGSAVATTLVSSLSGDLGAWTAAAATGFSEGSVQGETHIGNVIAAQARTDLSAAYADAQSRPHDTSFAGDQSGMTFLSGVHRTGAAFELAAGGVVTLDARGDPNAVFIFQIDGALNTAALSTIVLINSASPSRVFWASTGAAGTGADSSFTGTILTAGAVTIGARGTLIGRALAQGALTLAGNTIRFSAAAGPTLAIDGGPASTTTNRTPTLSGTSTAADGDTVTVTVGGQTLTSTVSSGRWTTTAGTLATGIYPVQVRVRDATGNAAMAVQTLVVL